MPDISMCKCHLCPLSNSCYRYTAIPNIYQAYADFKPDKEGNCNYYWNNKGYERRVGNETNEKD